MKKNKVYPALAFSLLAAAMVHAEGQLADVSPASQGVVESTGAPSIEPPAILPTNTGNGPAVLDEANPANGTVALPDSPISEAQEQPDSNADIVAGDMPSAPAESVQVEVYGEEEDRTLSYEQASEKVKSVLKSLSQVSDHTYATIKRLREEGDEAEADRLLAAWRECEEKVLRYLAEIPSELLAGGMSGQEGEVTPGFYSEKELQKIIHPIMDTVNAFAGQEATDEKIIDGNEG